MKSITDFLRESINDNISDEFNLIKDIFCNQKNYKDEKGHNYGYTNKYINTEAYSAICPELIESIDSRITNSDKISLQIELHKNTTFDDEKNNCYSFQINFHERGTYKVSHSTSMEYIPLNEYKTFKSFIDKYVNTIFKDINTFKRFCMERL